MSRRNGQFIRRGEKRWTVRVYDGTDAAGKRRYINESVEGSRRDAQAKLTEMLRERDRGTLAKPTQETVGQFLDQWLDGTKARTVRASTLLRYRDDVARYIRPALGHRRLRDLRAEEIDEFYTSLNQRGLRSRTVRHVHAILSGALQQAMKWSRIGRNPAKLVTLPPLERSSARSLNGEQAKAFVVAAEADRYGALLLLAISTGMRPGEYEGLGWAAVDLEAGRVNVCRAIVHLRKSEWRFEGTKTGRDRSIAISPVVVRALKAHRAKQAQARLAAGGAWQDHDLVFTNELGGPIQHRNLVSRHFKAVLQAAKIPTSIRLYDLRHTFGTMMIGNGVDIRTVSDVLGHSSTSTTLDIYSHALDANRRQASEKITEILWGKASRVVLD